MTSREITASEQARLRTLNLGAAALHLAQAIAVVILATAFTLPITASYLAGPPGTPPGPATVLADMPTGLAVAGFLFLSFLAHLIVGTVWFRNYIGDLSRQINGPGGWSTPSRQP